MMGNIESGEASFHDVGKYSEIFSYDHIQKAQIEKHMAHTVYAPQMTKLWQHTVTFPRHQLGIYRASPHLHCCLNDVTLGGSEAAEAEHHPVGEVDWIHARKILVIRGVQG